MATQLSTRFFDDIDGSEDNVRTVQFSFDGKAYEIDLSEHNLDRLTTTIAEYIESARKVRGHGKVTRSPSGRSGTVRAGYELANKQREWLRSHGHEVSDRGRIAARLKALLPAELSGETQEQVRPSPVPRTEQAQPVDVTPAFISN